MHKIVLLFLSTFYFVFPFSIQGKQIPPHMQMRPQYLNIFTTEIYDSYQAQLEAFVREQQQKRPLLAEAAVKEPFNTLYLLLTQKGSWENSNGRAAYTHVVMSAFRYALEARLANPAEDLADKEWYGFVDDLSVWMFTQVDIAKPTKDFLDKAAGMNREFYTTAYLADPKNYIMDIHNYTVAHPKFKDDKKSSIPREKEDNYLNGDIASKLYTLQNGTQVVRMPNVAHDLAIDEKLNTAKAEINPEFRNYVQTLSRQKKSHFYVNVLSRATNEKIKSKEIESLETDPWTREGVIVITLDKDHYSPFYYQLLPYKEQEDAKPFMQEFVNKMKDPQGAYYWSQKLDRESWFQELETLVQTVHITYFGSKPTLTQRERVDFIELTYLAIIDTLTERFQPNFMNITCKQAVDRGPSLYALFYLVNHLKQGPLGDKERAEFLHLLFAPPLAYHDRAAHDYRIIRVQGAANYLDW